MSEIRFFDANVYIGKTAEPKNSIISTPEELIREMRRVRIDRALVFHKEALNDPAFGNELLISQISGYDELCGCAVLAPDASGEFGDIGEYFRHLSASGIKAIRLFPRLHFYTLKPYVLDGVLREAAAWHMPVLLDCVDHTHLGTVDSTWDYFPDFDSIYELARAWPQLPFILLIPGMTNHRQQYALLAACPNVYLETSSYSYRFIDHVCRRFSADRLICGSYMPVVDPAVMMTGVLYSDISETEKQMIAAGNLETLISRAGHREAEV